MTLTALVDPSPDALLAKRLVDAFGNEGAHRMWDEIGSKLTNVELAALAAYRPMWMRPKQMPPETKWRSWGSLTGRGWGKTDAIARFIVDEIIAGRAKRLGLAAQNETKTKSVNVDALIAASPPWCMPEWRATSFELVWPNGATAIAYTPEVPGAIRSENFDLVWLSEIQSWPVATREEAYSNFLFATRIGNARTLWDATPKKGHPILKRLLARAQKSPEKHVVVRGTTYENPHLTKGVVADMEAEYLGTQKGREELGGEMLDEADGALWKRAWIDHRPAPGFLRKVLSIDPAVTSRKGSDTTGMVGAALGVDGRGYVLRDDSGRHDVGAWAELALDIYVKESYDLILAETNKGGDLVAQNLRAAAKERKLTVVVIGKDAKAPPRLTNTVFIREVHARGAKEERAQPVATAYERGRVSHVVSLTSLEETLTTWEPSPGADSPGDMDALVHAVAELLDLTANAAPDPAVGFKGIVAASKALAAPASRGLSLGTLLGGGGGRGGRL